MSNTPNSPAREAVELPKHSLSRSEISTLRKILKRAFRQSPWHLAALQEVYRQVRSVWVAEFTEDNVFTTDDVLREHFENTQHTAAEAAVSAKNLEIARLIMANDRTEAVKWATGLVGSLEDGVRIDKSALSALLAAKQEDLDKTRADAERYRWLQGATESQVWQLFDRAETDQHLNRMIDEARAALSPIQGEARE